MLALPGSFPFHYRQITVRSTAHAYLSDHQEKKRLEREQRRGGKGAPDSAGGVAGHRTCICCMDYTCPSQRSLPCPTGAGSASEDDSDGSAEAGGAAPAGAAGNGAAAEAAAAGTAPPAQPREDWMTKAMPRARPDAADPLEGADREGEAKHPKVRTPHIPSCPIWSPCTLEHPHHAVSSGLAC